VPKASPPLLSCGRGWRRHAAAAAPDRPEGGNGDDRVRRHLPATEAKKLGIIDAIVEGGDVRKEAIARMTGPHATL
jgi:hypothetical protein